MSEKFFLPRITEKEHLQKNADLENYLLKLETSEGLYSFENLPDSFTAESTEAYANYFSVLASNSPDYNEVGGYIHLRRTPRALIFPTRLAVGQGEVTPPFARRHNHVLPVAVVHNHPTFSTFSQPPGQDINCVINGYEDKGDHIQVPVWILSTPYDNWTLLRTRETKTLDNYELYEISWGAKTYDEFLNFRRYGVPTARENSRDVFFELLKMAESESFGGPDGLKASYESLYGTFAVAKACNLGFYHSYKDGKYQRVTSELLDHVMELRYEEALRRTHKKD